MSRIHDRIHGIAFALALSLSTPALAAQPEDAWITTKVKMALLTDEMVDGLEIDVDTFDGVVTLHGQVATSAEKARAKLRAGEIDGVRDVRNLLAIVPEAAREITAVADETIAERVSAILEEDRRLAESEIEVESVNDGVVVLSGKASTLSAHRRALTNARGVDGVRRVASQIHSPDRLGDREIWQEGESTAMDDAQRAITDAAITTQAKLFLMADPGISPLSVNVDTRRGVVTLFGMVESEALKERAGAEVATLTGVNGVENELQVVPEGEEARVEARDETLLAAVEKRLAAREALSDADIDVEVAKGVTRLTGSVASQRDRVAALSVASSTNGVDSVIDDLEVQAPGT